MGALGRSPRLAVLGHWHSWLRVASVERAQAAAREHQHEGEVRVPVQRV